MPHFCLPVTFPPARNIIRIELQAASHAICRGADCESARQGVAGVVSALRPGSPGRPAAYFPARLFCANHANTGMNIAMICTAAASASPVCQARLGDFAAPVTSTTQADAPKTIQGR